MNFPQFWARSSSGGFACWRWSAQSLAEAQALAREAAQKLADRFRAGGDLHTHSGDYYPNRPFRELVLQEIRNEAGEISAVVTRNSHGCQVLNTARVMFVDVDLPDAKPAGVFQRLFGKSPGISSPRHADAAMERVENWTRNHPEWGWRIYRTRAGLRLLATHALVSPESGTADGVFEALGADPLYRKLCQSQKCFRARLTPKPWRCGIHTKPARWPWLNAKELTRFQKWEAQYQSYAFNWATCELLREIGTPAVHPEIQAVLQIHDTVTRVASKLKLA